MDAIKGFAEADAWRRVGSGDKMLTLARRGEKVMVAGDFEIVNNKLVLFRPGVTVTVGKGGLTVGEENYRAGDVLQLDQEGKAQPIGRWKK